MVLRCSACQATYRVDAERVQNTRLKVRCPGCGHVFRVRSAVRQPAYAGGSPSGGAPSQGLEIERDDRRPPQVAQRGKLPRLKPSRPRTPPATPKPKAQPQTEMPRWDRERTIDFNSGSTPAPSGLETAPFRPGAASPPSVPRSVAPAPAPAPAQSQTPQETPATPAFETPTQAIPAQESAAPPHTPQVTTPEPPAAPTAPPQVAPPVPPATPAQEAAPPAAPEASTPAPQAESAPFQLPSGSSPPAPVLDSSAPTPQPMATPLAEPELEPPPIGPLPIHEPPVQGDALDTSPKQEPLGDTKPFDLPTQSSAPPQPAPPVSTPEPPTSEHNAPAPVAAPQLSSDATRRAHRLARVLVSDILVYNQDVRDRALREGNLASALGSEINKAWELYKTKVDARVLHTTSYFKDALNEILANGQVLF